MSQALVLNASFEPLHLVSWQRAVQLLFQGKVEVIEESDREIRTVRITMKVPAVLRLLKYVPLTKKKQFIRFSRQNVFIRDNHTCQYCGARHFRTTLTLDHVIPVVQGGEMSWKNIVTACKPCNQRKGGRTPQQAAMQLLQKPKQPHWLPNLSIQVGLSKSHDRWKLYLGFSGDWENQIAVDSDFDDD